MIKFDHIEVHVKDAAKYSEFLAVLFGGGRSKRISDNGTYMFLSADDLHIEVKQNKDYERSFNVKADIGFCLPCLRMKGALQHLQSIKNIEMVSESDNPDGKVYFFKDYEGVIWHIKDYDIQDIYINI